MAMDITSATATAAVAANATPDSDADTPPRPTSNNKPMGFLAYANGALNLKRHYPTKTEPAAVLAPAPAPAAVVSYRECMRNHAAAIGGHALDGCCEFMPAPMFSPSDPTSLRCVACGCHRNFHRRDPDDPAPLQLHHENKTQTVPFPTPLPPPPADSPSSPPTPATLSSAPQMLISLRKSQSESGGGVDPAANGTGGGRSSSSGASAGKKRFRTKFSHEQKDKMYDFARRLGWKMQKMDKAVVEEFCAEIGVGKEVLKVWLHNNKNTLGRRDMSTNTSNNGGNGDRTFADEASVKNGGAYFQRVHLEAAIGSSSSSG